MEGVLNIESDHWMTFGLSFLTLVIGLMIGFRFRQVICKTLQPVIHKYNIHHLIPCVEVKEKVKEDAEREGKEESEGKKED